MAFKRVKLTAPMDAAKAEANHAAVAKDLGREIRVFTKSATSPTSELSASSSEEPDDFYDLTPEDYYRIMADRIGARSQVLKTRKIREAEAAARRARLTKAVIRVYFPDNYVLEATFHPSEKIHTLVDLLMKVLARPDLPFYLYTTPPKERIKDTSKDFYSAGFAPGAVVYFSYDLAKDSDGDVARTGPYLRNEILELNGLLLTPEQADIIDSKPETAAVETVPPVPEPTPVVKKSTKPKWFKM